MKAKIHLKTTLTKVNTQMQDKSSHRAPNHPSQVKIKPNNSILENKYHNLSKFIVKNTEMTNLRLISLKNLHKISFRW